MGIYRIGAQRVGIERDLPVLDDNGDPVLTEFGQPLTMAVVSWVENCLFEVPQAPEEQQADTVTTSETGWALIPVTADGMIPASPAPIRFLGADGTPAVSSSDRLIHDGLRYAMRGDAVLERDLRGRPDHVFCRCERERG